MGLKSPPLVGAEAERRGQGERWGAAEALEGCDWLEEKQARKRRKLGSLDGKSGWAQPGMPDNHKVSKTCPEGWTPGRFVGLAQGFPKNAHWGCSQIWTGSVDGSGRSRKEAERRVGMPQARPQEHSGICAAGRQPRMALGPASAC